MPRSPYYLPPSADCKESDPCKNPDAQSSYLAYTGPPLPCTGVNPCDTLTVVIQKIEHRVCETEGDIPVNTSDLVNDSGFITISDIPAEEDPVFNLWLANTPPAYPGDIPTDISELTDNTGIVPTDTNDLTNGAGYITAGDVPIDPDEKVKYDVGDTVAGYVADKVIAGTGISVAEGTGGNENKLVITNSDTGSSAIGTHEFNYDHTLIATALQDISGQDLSTADNSTSAFIIAADVSANETDPSFNAWLIATPPLYSYVETDPDFNAWLLATPPLYSYTETDPVVGAINGIVKANGAGVISAALAGDMPESASYRTVTDTEKSTWNNKLDNADLGTVNEVLHGNPSGLLSFGAVIEDDILLSNVTTNNASITKHGFLDQLPGSTTVFKRGDGAWAAPASVSVPNAYIEESFAYTLNVAHNIAHNFGAKPLVQAINSSGEIEHPIIIYHYDNNNVRITMDSSATYTIILTMGSPPLQT